MVFRVDPEIQSFLPKMGEESYGLLRKNIIARHEAGHKVDNLVIINVNGDHFLGDGHNRKDICDGEGIPYEFSILKMSTREEAIQWIIENQLGKRNLTDAQRSDLRGRLYLNTKNGHGGDRASSQNGNLKTAEKIAKTEGVSKNTVLRDAEFSKGLDELKPEAKAKVLSGEATVTKSQVATGIFCPNCTKKGPKSMCRECFALREKAKESKPTNGKPKEPKSGRLKFDDRKVEDMIGRLTRLLNDRAQALGHQKHPGWKSTHSKMSDLIEAWEAWQKA